ncbi:MAG: NAD(P)-dependent oxidoreductase [Erysipelotrichaceae bacterium]|nr:NAD(P)-dependent oxidoreductase [Erysipelotrichaceae bacterium]
MKKKTIALTGATGIMGYQTFLELMKRKDEVSVTVLIRESKKAHQMFDAYQNDPAVRIVWGNLVNYEDVLNLVDGAEYVLHIGGMVSPKADYYPVTTLRTNVSAAENIVKAVKAQANPDEVKVVYIGTVAQTGDRNPPIHWGRTGDPIKISVYDHYAISKTKAEAVFAESGLKYWVSLRQSGILYPDILKNMEPIMYHVPMNGVLEWATVEDSGRLMANICTMDLPDSFYRKFYNIGSGEQYRLTNYEFEDLILNTLGLGSPTKLFSPNWFTTKNFHGQWYVDSNALEEICHFRANIPVKEYFKEMMNHVEPFYKLAFLGRPYAPILKHTWMKSIAQTKTYGTLWWVQQNVEERMSAYFGSMEEYCQIPKNWKDFKLTIPSKKAESEEVIVLNHGYDETKPFDQLTLEDLRKAAEFRGGQCLASEIVDMYTPVLWKSARGNEFMMSPNLVLKGGHWCPEELPWPWDYDTEAKLNPFFAQVWYPLHNQNQMHVYGSEIFDNFKEKVE